MTKPPSVSTCGGTGGNATPSSRAGHVQRQPPVDLEAAVGVADDRRDLLGVLLVLDLADDLLQQVLAA